MKKKEVADYLGISSKTVDRYVKRGILTVRHKNKSIHSECEFDVEQVRSLKELVGQDHKTIIEVQKKRKSPQEIYFEMQTKPDLINKLYRVLPDLKEFIFSLIKPYVLDLISSSPSEINHKLTLSLSEATTLSGISRNQLYQDLKKGKLKGIKVLKRWRIKRIDLDDYIKSL